MKKIYSLFLSVFFLLVTSTAFSQLVEIPFSEKVDSSSAIFEGKVKNTYSFWNVKHTRIYTANVIEVFKIFKGDSISSMVEVITEGGQLENQIQEASHSLTLLVGDVGMFFADLTKESDSLRSNVVITMYTVYAGTQGFIKYNLNDKTAADPFTKYKNIKTELYDVIIKQTGENVKVLKLVNIAPLNSSSTEKKEKKCSWSKLFKCKSKKSKD